MSGGAKFIIAVVVLVLILFGAWYWFKGQVQEPVDTSTQTQATTTQETAQVPEQENLLKSNDVSDATLASDLSAIDAQMNVIAGESAQVDSSLNDKSAQ